MNRSRTLILLGVVLLLGAVALLVLTQSGTPAAPPPENTPVPEAPSTMILVAAQDIPRGTLIGPDAVRLVKWPNSGLPPATDPVLVSPDQVKGQRARTDIYLGQPILQRLITSSAADLAATGNDAALFIPPGKVAVAFPIGQISDVGYAVGAGDHIDLLVSFSVVDANQEGQYPTTPFNQDLYDQLRSTGAPADQALQAVLALMGKSEQPRLLSQLALQNIEVLHVGEWPAVVEPPRSVLTPTDQTAPPQPVGTPTPLPPRPTMLILLVDQQQALILQWFREAKVTVDLALRAAGDNAPVSTDTVSYEYVLTNFNISIPPKLNTIIQNPITTPGQ